MSTGHIGTLTISFIILIIVLTILLHYYIRFDKCFTNPNYWCRTDYTCGTGDTKTFPAQDIYGCKPGVVRDSNYCKNNPNANGCLCVPDPQTPHKLPDTCTCDWTSDNLGDCAILYCEVPQGDVSKCNL